jgi:hypothetical protein
MGWLCLRLPRGGFGGREPRLRGAEPPSLGWDNLIKRAGFGEALAELQEAVKGKPGRPAKQEGENPPHRGGNNPTNGANHQPKDRKSRLIRTLVNLKTDPEACKAKGTTTEKVSAALALEGTFAEAGDNQHTLKEGGLHIVQTTEHGHGNSAAYLAARLKKAGAAPLPSVEPWANTHRIRQQSVPQRQAQVTQGIAGVTPFTGGIGHRFALRKLD